MPDIRTSTSVYELLDGGWNIRHIEQFIKGARLPSHFYFKSGNPDSGHAHIGFRGVLIEHDGRDIKDEAMRSFETEDYCPPMPLISLEIDDLDRSEITLVGEMVNICLRRGNVSVDIVFSTTTKQGTLRRVVRVG